MAAYDNMQIRSEKYCRKNNSLKSSTPFRRTNRSTIGLAVTSARFQNGNLLNHFCRIVHYYCGSEMAATGFKPFALGVLFNHPGPLCIDRVHLKISSFVFRNIRFVCRLHPPPLAVSQSWVMYKPYSPQFIWLRTLTNSRNIAGAACIMHGELINRNRRVRY